MTAGDEAVLSLFVYGTLRRGDVRWHHLRPFVDDLGIADTTPGRLYDSGLGYPAARFGGETFGLVPHRLEECLTLLDEVEGTVAGLYARVRITTGRGVVAWSYQYGGGLGLTPIASGDWLRRGAPA
jgi:gamma-glutamylcyclotransferase (GGCT)/AIG2-like uncharacterized protein YtfP